VFTPPLSPVALPPEVVVSDCPLSFPLFPQLRSHTAMPAIKNTRLIDAVFICGVVKDPFTSFNYFAKGSTPVVSFCQGL
jgi:hypothetical protein